MFGLAMKSTAYWKCSDMFLTYFIEVLYHILDTEGRITNTGMILTVCILLSSSHLLQRN